MRGQSLESLFSGSDTWLTRSKPDVQTQHPRRSPRFKGGHRLEETSLAALNTGAWRKWTLFLLKLPLVQYCRFPQFEIQMQTRGIAGFTRQQAKSSVIATLARRKRKCAFLWIWERSQSQVHHLSNFSWFGASLCTILLNDTKDQGKGVLRASKTIPISQKNITQHYMCLDSPLTITQSFTVLTLASSSFCLSNITVLWTLPASVCGRKVSGKGVISSVLLQAGWPSEVRSTWGPTYCPWPFQVSCKYPTSVTQSCPGKVWQIVNKATEKAWLTQFMTTENNIHPSIQWQGTTQEFQGFSNSLLSEDTVIRHAVSRCLAFESLLEIYCLMCSLWQHIY